MTMVLHVVRVLVVLRVDTVVLHVVRVFLVLTVVVRMVPEVGVRLMRVLEVVLVFWLRLVVTVVSCVWRRCSWW